MKNMCYCEGGGVSSLGNSDSNVSLSHFILFDSLSSGRWLKSCTDQIDHYYFPDRTRQTKAPEVDQLSRSTRNPYLKHLILWWLIHQAATPRLLMRLWSWSAPLLPQVRTFLQCCYKMFPKARRHRSHFQAEQAAKIPQKPTATAASSPLKVLMSKHAGRQQCNVM